MLLLVNNLHEKTSQKVWSDSVSAYVRAHVRVRVRAGAYKRVHVCSCVLVYVVRAGTVLLE